MFSFGRNKSMKKTLSEKECRNPLCCCKEIPHLESEHHSTKECGGKGCDGCKDCDYGFYTPTKDNPKYLLDELRRTGKQLKQVGLKATGECIIAIIDKLKEAL